MINITKSKGIGTILKNKNSKIRLFKKYIKNNLG